MQVPPFHGNIAFNAHHSPMGAYFTFTCGHFGTRGGLGAQLGKPANQDLFIGVKEGDRYAKSPLRCLPFFDAAENAATQETAYAKPELTRHYAWATDTWKSPDFEFSIYSPFDSIPEPAVSSSATMRAALLPAVTAELLINNRKGKTIKTGFFAINFNEGGARILDEGIPKGRVGFALRSHLGVAAELVELKPDGTRLGSAETGNYPFLFMRGTPQEGLEDKSNPIHLLGTCPGIGFEVPAGKTAILRLALGCYVGGIVTTRLEGRYLYRRYFANLQDVLNEALTYVRFVKVDCNTLNDKLLLSGLNPDQQFLIAHGTRSYYGNTQLLEVAGQPYWVVNEGEYCMMNTLDLAVDHVFWELKQNPWVVRNLLDNYVRYYSYHDQVKVPTPPLGAPDGNPGLPLSNTPTEASYTLAPGGLSFCHDQGVHNQFSPFGQSAYELKDLTGCFSYMTQEQLCNWILIAASYVCKTGDYKWAKANANVIESCWGSIITRQDHPGLNFTKTPDSVLTGNGAEITTYDSLDPSLGQARLSAYLAAKRWVALLGMAYLEYLVIDGKLKPRQLNFVEEIFSPEFTQRLNQQGFIPAIFNSESPDDASRILPVIEALVFLLQIRGSDNSGLWKWDVVLSLTAPTLIAKFLTALRTHTTTLLSDPERRNKFADNGIRLSSTSDNSWISKIALVQHVARELFNLNEDGQERKYKGDASGWEKSDAAHVKWQTEGASAYWACSDQFVNGVATGSRYYPRLITATLWLRDA